MKEKQVHLDAFEKYFQHKQSGKNTEDSIKLLISDFKVTRKSIYVWKKEFNWDERETLRSLEINKKVEEKTNTNIVDSKAGYLSIINHALDNYVNEVKQGKRKPVEVKGTYDLNNLIKLGLLVQGEATEHIREESNQNHKIKLDKINDLFKEAEKGNET